MLSAFSDKVRSGSNPQNLPISQPILAAILILGPYGIVFFAMTTALRVAEASTALARVARLRR